MESNTPEDNTADIIIDLNNRGPFSDILKHIYDVADGKVEKNYFEWETSLKIDYSKYEHDDLDNYGLNLKTLSADDFKDFDHLDSLTIRGTKLEHINPDAFKNLKKLERLCIADCNLEDLDSRVFSGLTSLKSLTISQTKIITLTDKHFLNLTNLEELNLEENKISTLDGGTFRHLEKLVSLNLSKNPLQDTLAGEIFANKKNLMYLKLNSTMLTSIAPYTFDQLSALQTLDLSDCELKIEISKDTFLGLSSLLHLRLRSNSITGLSEDCFKDLVLLKELDLSYNHIEKIGAHDLRHLKELRNIDISDNKISSTLAVSKTAFADSEKLRHLDLSRNIAKRFDRELLGLKEQTNSIWDYSHEKVSFYDQKIRNKLAEQDTFIPWGSIPPFNVVFSLLGLNKIHLFYFLKCLPFVFFLALILSSGLEDREFYQLLELPAYYSAASIILFLVSYRYRLFRLYKLKPISMYDSINQEFLLKTVTFYCTKHGVKNPPEIGIVPDTDIANPICDIVGIRKNNFVLYVNDALFTNLCQSEIEEVIDKKIKEATTLTMPINTIFRAAVIPTPFLAEFHWEWS